MATVSNCSPRSAVSPAWGVALASPAILGAALLAGGLATQVVLAILSLSIVVALVVVCAATDVATRRIPNFATYPAFLWALAIAATASATGATSASVDFAEIPVAAAGSALAVVPVGFGQAVAGAGVCFLLMLIVHTMSRGGAGDVKLATALGALLGLKLGVLALCATFILAGLFALAIVIWRVGPLAAAAMLLRWIGSFLFPTAVQPAAAEQAALLGQPLPLGVFFALGTLLTFFDLAKVLS